MEEILNIPKIYTANAEFMAVVATILVYRRFLPRKPLKYLLTLAALGACYGIIRVFQLICQENDGVIWLAAMTGAVLTMVVIIKIVLNIKWHLAFYIGARTFMWAELAASFSWQLWHFYTFGKGVAGSPKAGMIFSLVVYAVVLMFYFFLESSQLPKDKNNLKVTASYGNVAFAWTITLLLFTLSNLSFLLRDNPFSGTSATDIFYIRTLSDIVGVVMGQMFHLQKCDTERREENAAFQTVLRNQYIQFRESKDNIEMINRKYHDLKHQLQILRETSNDEERTTYIDEIQQGIERYEAENKTGNNVLDTVLASKQSRCLNENITMTVVADGTLINRLSVMDICTIFGNALDNAIEYELKVKEQEKRLIHVTLAERNGFACILVENYYEGSAISKGSLPETTKHNKKYHGFGLRSVKYTCEKYGGYINTSVRDGWFRLEMIIPKA